MDTQPSYLNTPAVAQACAALQRAAQASLEGVTGGSVTLALEKRDHLPSDGLAGTSKNVFIELQFEWPADVHHSIIVLADAAELTGLFGFEAPAEGEIFAAEGLLQLGDIVSTFLDTISGDISWLQPAPRAWLSNLEPVEDGGASLELPAAMAAENTLYQIDVSLAGASGTCTFQVVFGEQTERILLGLDDGSTRAPAAAPAPADIPSPGAAASTAAPTSVAGDENAPAVAKSAAPVQSAQFKPLAPDAPATKTNSIDLIRDVPLRVSVELGRASMTVREVLALGAGSVVELDRLAGEPVDVLVNDRLIARGEVVIVDESFGVRITELLREPQKRGIA